MKKLTLTVAVLLSATYAFSQANISTGNQSGNWNQAVVNQTGASHLSDIQQISTAALGSPLEFNKAKVTQKDLGGLNSNEAFIKHNGKSNRSTVEQEGDNKLSSYIGSRVGAPSTPDYGQFDANAGNETYAKQVGSGNVGEQSIYGAQSTTTYLELKQTGTSNNSTQNGAWSTNSNGFVNQNGQSNGAYQQIDGGNELASTVQSGNGNSAFQWIQGGGSNDNISSIIQTGNSNTAGVVTNGDFNLFSATQLGNSNIVQGIGGSNATQNGNDNSAVLLQTGNTNTFSVRQAGNDNTITGVVGYLPALGAHQLGSGNTASIDQDGFNNTSRSIQKGSGNAIALNQDGVDNVSIVRQYKSLFASSNNNTATVNQTGTGNSSTAIQNGNGNSYVATQTGGAILP